MDRSRQLALLRAAQIPVINGNSAGTLKAILRCIDDHGTSCWASLSTLATESCFSRRTVIRAVEALEQSGYIVAQKLAGRTTTYRVDYQKLHQCQPVTSANASPVPPCHLTSDTLSKTSDTLSPKAVEAVLSGSIVAQAAQFQEVWDLYPKRNGRKLHRDKALAEFKKIKAADFPLVMRAVSELAKSDQYPPDCFRWLRGAWREWLPSEPAKPAKPKLVGIGKALFDDMEKS